MKNEPPFDVLYVIGLVLWIVSAVVLGALMCFPG